MELWIFSAQFEYYGNKHSVKNRAIFRSHTYLFFTTGLPSGLCHFLEFELHNQNLCLFFFKGLHSFIFRFHANCVQECLFDASDVLSKNIIQSQKSNNKTNQPTNQSTDPSAPPVIWENIYFWVVPTMGTPPYLLKVQVTSMMKVKVVICNILCVLAPYLDKK